MNQIYLDTARLLIQVAPLVFTDNSFALKGGTAINLFVRDMPRLSVDIDLTYLPIADRAASLREINAAMGRIRDAIRRGIPVLGSEKASFHRKTARRNSSSG